MKRIILLSAISIMFGCALPPTQVQIDTAYYGDYPVDFKQTVESYIRATMKDPDAAKFQNWRGPKKGYGFNKYFGYKVCVDVNGKNSYGGYVGYRTAYAILNDHRIIYYQIADENDYSNIKQWCYDNLDLSP